MTNTHTHAHTQSLSLLLTNFPYSRIYVDMLLEEALYELVERQLITPHSTSLAHRTPLTGDTLPYAPMNDAPRNDAPRNDVPKNDVPRNGFPRNDAPRSGVPRDVAPVDGDAELNATTTTPSAASGLCSLAEPQGVAQLLNTDAFDLLLSFAKGTVHSEIRRLMGGRSWPKVAIAGSTTGSLQSGPLWPGVHPARHEVAIVGAGLMKSSFQQLPLSCYISLRTKSRRQANSFQIAVFLGITYNRSSSTFKATVSKFFPTISSDDVSRLMAACFESMGRSRFLEIYQEAGLLGRRCTRTLNPRFKAAAPAIGSHTSWLLSRCCRCAGQKKVVYAPRCGIMATDLLAYRRFCSRVLVVPALGNLLPPFHRPRICTREAANGNKLYLLADQPNSLDTEIGRPGDYFQFCRGGGCSGCSSANSRRIAIASGAPVGVSRGCLLMDAMILRESG